MQTFSSYQPCLFPWSQLHTFRLFPPPRERICQSAIWPSKVINLLPENKAYRSQIFFLFSPAFLSPFYCLSSQMLPANHSPTKQIPSYHSSVTNSSVVKTVSQLLLSLAASSCFINFPESANHFSYCRLPILLFHSHITFQRSTYGISYEQIAQPIFYFPFLNFSSLIRLFTLFMIVIF